MGIYLNPGNKAFKITSTDSIYVDKTNLISFTNSRLGTGRRFINVSRPRRFGKSVAAGMLAAYYDKSCNSAELFSDYQIAKDLTFQRHLNQHNVLFLNIQHFLSRTDNIQTFTSYLEKTVLKELKQEYSEEIDPEEEHLSGALEKIYSRTEQGFVIIIDEWDCIFREKKEDTEVQKRFLDFLRDLLKDQIYVDLAYMTGILPIKKYGTHSALNMFEEYSMTDSGQLAEFFGFTEIEVEDLCKKHHMDFQEMKRWYDGYLFENDLHIYNPKSVVDALHRKKFGNYWTGTETYEALKVYIDMNFDGLKNAVIIMLDNGRCKINPRIFQNDMTTFKSKSDVLTLLVHLGYLAYDAEKKEVFIPNQEITDEFENAIESGGWDEVAHTLQASEDLTWNH